MLLESVQSGRPGRRRGKGEGAGRGGLSESPGNRLSLLELLEESGLGERESESGCWLTRSAHF